jgi:hypothetical protein
MIHLFSHLASWANGDFVSSALQMTFLPLAIAGWNSVIFWMFRFSSANADKRIYGEKTGGFFYNIIWWVRGYGYSALGLMIAIGGMLGLFGAAPEVAIALVRFGTAFYDFVQWSFIALAGLWFYYYWKQLDTFVNDNANFVAESTDSATPNESWLWNGLLEFGALLSLDYWISSQMALYTEAFTTGVAMNEAQAIMDEALAEADAENDKAAREAETFEEGNAEDDFFMM